MTTGGTATALYQGVGGTYPKSWDLQPVTAVDVPTEIASLLASASAIAESYAAVTKGLLLSCSLKVDATVTPIAAETGAYKNRAAAILTNVDGNPAKKITLYVQAARDGIFIGNDGDATVVDTADVALNSYMTDLNGAALVSDGEIPSDTPTSGYRIDRANSTKD